MARKVATAYAAEAASTDDDQDQPGRTGDHMCSQPSEPGQRTGESRPDASFGLFRAKGTHSLDDVSAGEPAHGRGPVIQIAKPIGRRCNHVARA